jgi:hypothetical protein
MVLYSDDAVREIIRFTRRDTLLQVHNSLQAWNHKALDPVLKHLMEAIDNVDKCDNAEAADRITTELTEHERIWLVNARPREQVILDAAPRP